MLYVAAVVAVAANVKFVNDAVLTVAARLTGLKTYPVLLGDIV